MMDFLLKIIPHYSSVFNNVWTICPLNFNALPDKTKRTLGKKWDFGSTIKTMSWPSVTPKVIFIAPTVMCSPLVVIFYRMLSLHLLLPKLWINVTSNQFRPFQLMILNFPSFVQKHSLLLENRLQAFKFQKFLIILLFHYRQIGKSI